MHTETGALLSDEGFETLLRSWDTDECASSLLLLLMGGDWTGRDGCRGGLVSWHVCTTAAQGTCYVMFVWEIFLAGLCDIGRRLQDTVVHVILRYVCRYMYSR